MAVLVAGVLGGCSGPDPEQVANWRETFCTRLGAWQEARDAAEGGAANAGRAVVAAAKVLDREGLDQDGSHVLIDTALAVEGDLGAAGRAASYCDGVGFETLVG
ncbi:hypothetical protein [Streptomyces sp. JW3]|uniref:hypothetical protein n=1 Tax=Streptomyces sp. JW3 TaxID=3456955 RepID=UPI003FA46175